MKRDLFLTVLLLNLLFSLSAQNGTIRFLEGDVQIKTAGGSLLDAEIGQAVEPGVSLLTAADGYAEVELEGGSLITVNSDTIFAFSEIEDREEKGKKRGVFSCFLGSLGFKFKKMARKEPYIETPATICGIRGTEFSVFAGAEGSTLYAVASGEVAVTAGGQEVALLPEEGVKVAMGQAPGPKFEVVTELLDFSQMAELAQAEAMEDPIGTIKRMTVQLQGFIEKADHWEELRIKEIENEEIVKEQFFKLKESGTEEEIEDFKENILKPALKYSPLLRQNARHYIISGYSLRRYLAANLYIGVRTKYILDQSNPEYMAFMKEYGTFLTLLDEKMVQTEYLYQGDI